MADETPRITHIGKAQKFVVGADFEGYAEQLDFFFVANGINDAKQKKAVLLTSLPAETYQLAKDLVAPSTLKDDAITFDTIVERLQRQLKPQKSALVARYEFDNRSRNPGETVSDYVAVLKHLAMECKFSETVRLERLRDRLVSGIRDRKMLADLLKMKLDELTFDAAVAKCVALERSYNDVELMQGRKEVTESNSVHKIGNVYAPKQTTRKHVDSKENKAQRAPESAKCYRCLGDHDQSSCPFKKEVCHFCKKRGHIKRACKTRQRETKGPQPKVNLVDDSDDSEMGYDSDDLLGSLSVNKVGNKENIIWVTPTVEGTPLKMELDTGSAVSVIPVRLYKKLYSHVELQPSPITLKTYTGEKIIPKGKINCKVNLKSQTECLDLQVVETPGPALFGRDWLSVIQLDWGEIKTLKLSTSRAVPTPTPGGVDKLLQEYKSVFEDGLGTLKGHQADLKVHEDCQPRFFKPRPVPYALRPKVEAELIRLEKEGILSPIEHSEWATPIVPVVKRNGSVRICGDFKVSVNPALIAEQYPLPRIEDIFANLAGGKRFSKLDLRQAYHQMEVTEESKKLLTINTHKGLFQYNRLVFGVTSSPAIWQRAMDQILQGIPGTQCILDDMIITGKTDDEHLQNLEQVLKQLQKKGLKANLEKCKFFSEKIEFCGHEIDSNGLHKTQEKIEAVVNAPRPENVSQVRSFLGLINYYNRFLPNAATVLHPLHRLLEKGSQWQWTNECEQAFTEAKRLITSDLVLTHYDPELPVRLACDASPTGIGAVLSHVMPDGTERPIAFASRSLTQTERKYAQIDREALAIVWGVKKFHVYLYGRRFTLITDHQPLTAIFHQEKGIPAMTAARLQRYALFLAGFEYDIEYKNTKEHCNADGLSRLPLQQCEKNEEDLDSAEVFHASQFDPLPVTSESVARETRRDPVLAQVHESIMNGWSQRFDEDTPYYQRRSELAVHQGCILWGMRVVVPYKLQEKILQELHDSHLGIVKMKALARSYVWWPSINQQLEAVAKACLGCQQNQKMPSKVPLHPWEWATFPWQRIHIDYAGPFKDSMFLVVVDAHSKWPEVIPMKSTTSSKTIEVLRDMFATFGIPEQLVSDNGPQFVSEEFQTFLKLNGIRHITSAPYHPATNGQAERSVQTFKRALKAMEEGSQPIKEKLAKFLIAYRNTPHCTTGESPAVLMLGRPLRTRLDLVKPNLNRKMVSKHNELSMRVALAKATPTRRLGVGDTVMARDYRGNVKWCPAQVVEQTGPLMYRVQVAPDMIWRRHVDQLLPSQVPPPASVVTDAALPPTLPATTPQVLEEEPEVIPTTFEPEGNSDPVLAAEQPATGQRRYPERVRKPPQRLDL